MKLLTLEQTPNRFGGTVFRTNPLGPIVWLILVGMLTTAWVVAWRQGGLPLWALIPIEVLMTLFLLMAFKNAVPPQIVDALAAERRAKHVRKTWYGSTSGKFGDYPVSVLDPNTLRITFNSIRPSIKHALQWFRWQGIEEAPLNKESVDFTRDRADKARTDEKILQLASSGKTIDADRLARRACNMDLTEAKKVVDELNR